MLGDWLLYIRETSHEFLDLQGNIKNFVIFTFSRIETSERAIFGPPDLTLQRFIKDRM